MYFAKPFNLLEELFCFLHFTMGSPVTMGGTSWTCASNVNNNLLHTIYYLQLMNIESLILNNNNNVR